MPLHRSKRGRGDALDLDLDPLVQRTLMFLENSPRGASRKDILAAMGLHDAVWPALREALEASGSIISVGRGPGLRHVHQVFADRVPAESVRIAHRDERSQELDQARLTLRQVLRDQGELDSSSAQEITGLRADPVRRLLLELVDEGKVSRTGKKRSTRYLWKG